MKPLKFSCTIIFLLIYGLSNSQIIEWSNEKKASESEVIVTGFIQNSKTLRYKNEIYTQYIVKVDKTQKGHVPTEYINIYQIGGILGDEGLIVTPSNNMEIGEYGKYYLKYNAEDNVYYFAFTAESFEPILDGNTQNLENRPLALSISSISPTTLNAGTGDVLTITGSGFGATGPTSSTKLFVNYSDRVGFFSSLPNAYEYISWSDTEIKIKFPSKGGSGPVRIGNNNSGTISSQTVNVNLNVKDNPTANMSTLQTRYLPALNGNAIEFRPNVQFSDPQALKTTKIALDNWICATGINWNLNDSVFETNLHLVDNKNIIYYENTGNALGVTYVAFSFCSSTGRTYVIDIDIAINNTVSFNYTLDPTPSSQYDYFHVILHELGHARNLGHTLSTSDIMYPSVSRGTVNRLLSTIDINGGNWVQNDGQTNSLCGKPQISTGNCQNLALEDVEWNSSDIKVYPNPIKNEFKIATNSTIQKVELYSSDGRFLKELPIQNLSLNNISKGVYFLKIVVNEVSKIVKVIKD